jgi:hypothetical protein
LIRSLLFFLFCSFTFPAWAFSLRGMTLPDEFRLGPVVHSGIALGGALGDRQYYLLEVRGESPNHGFSRLFLRGVALYELLSLPTLNTTTPDPNPRKVRLHQQFISLGFESPVYFERTRESDFELGWTGGFTLERVTFKEPTKAAGQDTGIGAIFSDYPEIQPANLGITTTQTNSTQQGTQFIGGQLGIYSRYYALYPFVPYLSLGLNLGSFLDKKALVDGVEQKVSNSLSVPVATPTAAPTLQRQYKSAMRVGPILSAGLDFYIFSRGLIGIEYTFWNWDYEQSADYSHFLALKAGFLF